MFHASGPARKIWDEASLEGYHPLLNLVSDEHLERNLRALDKEYGDRLKVLCAYAFRHSARDIRVDLMLRCLGARAFLVLSATRLEVSRDANLCPRRQRAVALFARAGRVLVRSVYEGTSPWTWQPAQRPKGRPRVELFEKDFRQSDMAALRDIALELREIFHDESELLLALGQDGLGEPTLEGIVRGEGITDDQLQQEVERVLNPSIGRREDRRATGGRAINVGAGESFEPIRHVEILAVDRPKHREYAAAVKRHAMKMRQYLDKLGLGQRPARGRLSGYRFDRTRAMAVVTRRDPRMLVARETYVRTDLFLGILIDCSGSMSHDDQLERAKSFAVMLAEAARGNSGIDLRIFGFDDTTIFDAGTAERCAVAALEVGGGNNDAAALHHAAEIAQRSKRVAKLLVMISDGLPTECSVTALRALVRRLSVRQGICCAQVAVRPLEEVCFEHYIELLEHDDSGSVRRFGEIMAKLVGRVIQ